MISVDRVSGCRRSAALSGEADFREPFLDRAGTPSNVEGRDNALRSDSRCARFRGE